MIGVEWGRSFQPMWISVAISVIIASRVTVRGLAAGGDGGASPTLRAFPTGLACVGWALTMSANGRRNAQADRMFDVQRMGS